jgi:HEPN domain-containing protein
VQRKLARDLQRGHVYALGLQKKDFDHRISRLKAEQNKSLARIVRSTKKTTSRIQRNADERARQDRLLFDNEFSRLKSSYQASIAQIKELHGRQSMMLFNHLKDLVESYVEQGRKSYDQLVENNQAQMLGFQRWLREELPNQILETVISEEAVPQDIEPESEHDVDKLVKEIDSRDEMIRKAEERIRELEGNLASGRRRNIWKRMRRASPEEPYKEEESSDPQQEVLSMIREIAQERSQIKAVREERKLPEFADSFGSRISKKMTH